MLVDHVCGLSVQHFFCVRGGALDFIVHHTVLFSTHIELAMSSECTKLQQNQTWLGCWAALYDPIIIMQCYLCFEIANTIIRSILNNIHVSSPPISTQEAEWKLSFIIDHLPPPPMSLATHPPGRALTAGPWSITSLHSLLSGAHSDLSRVNVCRQPQA